MSNSPLATNLRTVLAEREMTQEQLARRIDVSNRSVAGWCLGETLPRWPQLVKLGQEFGREPGWFYLDHSHESSGVAA